MKSHTLIELKRNRSQYLNHSETNKASDVDVIIGELFNNPSNASYIGNFKNPDIKFLANNKKIAIQVIESLTKSAFPNPLNLNELRELINAKIGTNFKKANAFAYALKVARINWRKVVNKKLGLYNYDFFKYADQAKDPKHKLQCLAMALIKEGKSHLKIAKELKIPASLVKTWLVAFVNGQVKKNIPTK